MLGTADEIQRNGGDFDPDTGDIDPRRLGLVLLVAALMAVGLGAGIWLTASGERPIADTSIVNVPRLRHDPIVPGRGGPVVAPVAPVAQVPADAPAPPAPPPAPIAPVAPHAVDVPVVIVPGYAGPVDVPDLPAPPDDSTPFND
ncbi:hypothetical protein ACFXHA_18595 [Nocardia sp. NPDC059240]|uniref:hypothetical protein n=1 Tax=Nocardia sp. NPDC059240 TaxID=3346786 RepID=UPI0036A5A800